MQNIPHVTKHLVTAALLFAICALWFDGLAQKIAVVCMALTVGSALAVLLYSVMQRRNSRKSSTPDE